MARASQSTAKKEAEAPAAAAGGAGETPERDSPLLDLSDAAVKKLIKAGKAAGYVTIDQLNAVLPSEEVTSEQIEDTMAMLSEMGITVVEAEDGDEEEAAVEEVAEEESESRALAPQNLPTKTSTKSEPTDRTDDPVRMYLREMGSVELLSREGEIAIATRIEAGREAMIAGLCESPLTFQAIIIWRDELNDAKILLRDIIDLEATYEGPEAKAQPPLNAEGLPQAEIPQPPSGAPEGDIDDDEEFENALSLAAMEAELKPKVLETFDNIAASYKKLRKQQDKKLEQQVVGEQGTRQQQKAYDKLREEIIVDVKSLSLNNNRI